MRKLLFIAVIAFFGTTVRSQTVGIGTTTPHAKAVLDINSTSKGVLFPRMTTAQRDAIIDPPDGLHIYNTTERGLNYYDSVYAIWNSYLDEYKTVIIHISASNASLNFYYEHAIHKKANRYLVIIDQGVTLLGLNPSDTALIFNDIPAGTIIILRNYGYIGGAGGAGGIGTTSTAVSSPTCGGNILGMPGGPGGPAISTRSGVVLSVTNYGLIAGGGGGGGTGDPGANGYGGGGGGGAGTSPGNGGYPGTFNFYSFSFPPGCHSNMMSSPGTTGTFSTGGIGGAGSVGTPPGGTGGNGGARGMPGQAGSNGLFAGGAAGKAIAGGSGNTLVNIGTGQSIGAVD